MWGFFNEREIGPIIIRQKATEYLHKQCKYRGSNAKYALFNDFYHPMST